jgi:hypothetical protein
MPLRLTAAGRAADTAQQVTDLEARNQTTPLPVRHTDHLSGQPGRRMMIAVLMGVRAS